MRARARSAIGLGMLLACCTCAFALDPKLDVSQYAHTAWKIREGFTKGLIQSMAQTPDGYLWLGTEFGILRFDGVRTVPWQGPPGRHLPSNSIWSLLAARDGTLWIGTDKGLASWRGDKLTEYPELAGVYVFRILEDRDGAVWVGGIGFPSGRLCAIQKGTARCYGEDGSLGSGVFGLYEDRNGNLWVGVLNGLWRWKPGPANFYAMPGEQDSIRAFAEDHDGALLFSTRTGIKRLINDRVEPYPLPGSVQQLRVGAMLRDRDGGLWVGTAERGVMHVRQGKTDVFERSDGLSGQWVNGLFEDREDNVWVVTSAGLDRFREFAVGTVSVDQGLSSASVGSVLAATDGSVWLGTFGGLNRWINGQITIPHTGGPKRDGKLSGEPPNSLFQDDRGRIWISTQAGFGYLEQDRFISVKGIPGGHVHGIAEDRQGNLWIANQQHGLIRLSAQGEVQQIPWVSLGHKDNANALIADALRGGLWLGFLSGGVSYFSDGGVRVSYGTADGLGDGAVHSFRIDQEGTLWASTAGGLSRLKNRHFDTLTSKNGLPCDAVHWMMEDDDHAYWLEMGCGLVRIARSDLGVWAAAADRGAARQDKEDAKRTIQASIHPTVFANSDGLATRPIPSSYRPLVAKSSDGRLWFTGLDGAGVLDPRHIPFNKIPPPVHIEQITADRKLYDVASSGNGNVRLPPRIRDLEIDYTALSLVAPEKVLFRYKLEGWDRDWQDAGTRRQAFYSNLPPRDYTFRVTACNNSGLWNEGGTFLDFSVAPAYYQTLWFRSLCVLAFLVLLAAFYRLRLRQLARQFNMRMEERVNERTRIARDLHDTLLQSFQGILMKFDVAMAILPDDAAEARKMFETTTEQARKAIAEGRDAVYGLRSSTVVTNELARAIRTVGEELAAVPSDGNCSDFHVFVEGASKDMVPLIRDEIYRVACEAVRNAFKHAHARRIEVELCYDPRKFRLRVSDNGRGIEPKVLAEGGSSGHYGLPGMQERGRLVRGKLTVRSGPDSGTEIELTIPGSVAYMKSSEPASQYHL